MSAGDLARATEAGLVFASVCSGIGAPEFAWRDLGWRCAFMAEIDPFARAVLAHRFRAGTPGGPQLFGDFTKIGRDDADGAIDLLVAGTPCQSFSVAGRRGGLDDPRGDLALEFLGLARRLRPRWLVWENVPGVRSVNGGRDLGTFLAALGQCGYGWAYRSLDAQYAGLAQRRERVFLVGHLGDWRPPAAVLFEREMLSGDSPPSREAGEGVARPIASGSSRGSGYRNDADTANNLIAFGGNDTRGPIEVATALNAQGGPHGRLDFGSEIFVVSHSLRGDGFDASEDGTGRGTPLVPIAFTVKDYGGDAGEIAPTLRAGVHARSHANAGVMPVVAFDLRGREGGSQFEGPHDTANIRASGGGSSRSYVADMAVRRLTPRECERLMGLPDDWTLAPYRGKPAKDGPRYRAVGNSMAVPLLRWIGERIALFEATTRGAP